MSVTARRVAARMTTASLAAALALFGSAAVAAHPAHAGVAPRAEYAVRWSPVDGGPADFAALERVVPVGGRDSTYDVRLGTLADDVDGHRVIVRERSGRSTNDVTVKQRGADGTAVSGRRCPLRGDARRKDEVDVSFGPDGSIARIASSSCTVAGGLDDALGARAATVVVRGCRSAVLRRRSHDGLTAERWRTEAGAVVVEVSTRGPDTTAALAEFRHRVVEPLVAAGVRPMIRSKTDIAGECRIPFPDGAAAP